MNSYKQGISRMSTTFTVDSTPTDPTTVTFTLEGAGTSVEYVYGTDAQLVKDDTGDYHVDYNFQTSGYYKYSFIGTGDCAAEDTDFIVIGSTADLIVSTSLVLHDTGNARFSETAVNDGIEKALVTVSQYFPYESKIDVDLTADSKDVDVSNIRGLMEVFYAEYKQDQDPKQFRNVKRFGDTITIDTNTTPASGDAAYLYCHLVQTADTLDVRLYKYVADLAAAYCMLDYVSEAVTAIEAAKTAILLINSSIDSITARLTQMVTDEGTMRTAASASFASGTTALGKAETSLNTDAEAALDKANADIESLLGADGATLIGVINEGSDKIDNAFTEAELQLANLETTHATLITNAIAEVTGGMNQVEDYIEDAISSSNLVPNWGSPVSDNLNAAQTELGYAKGKVNEMEAAFKHGMAWNPLVFQRLSIAKTYMAEATAKASLEAQLTSESLQEVRDRIRLAYGSIAEARAYWEADARKVNNLSQVIMTEARAINGYLNQARGYSTEVDSDLSTARLIQNQERIAMNRLALVETELKKIAKPKTRKSYPRD